MKDAKEFKLMRLAILASVGVFIAGQAVDVFGTRETLASSRTQSRCCASTRSSTSLLG